MTFQIRQLVRMMFLSIRQLVRMTFLIVHHLVRMNFAIRKLVSIRQHLHTSFSFVDPFTTWKSYRIV